MQLPKSDAQIDAMRTGGKILATIFRDLCAYVQPGMSELEIDAWVAHEIKAHGAEATYLTPEVNFPGVICISVNEDITHGIPTSYIIQPGDVVGFDFVITYDGMKTDSAFTMTVGQEATGSIKHLLKTTERSLYAGIDAIHGPTRVGDISAAVEKVLAEGKLGIIRDLVGHGIGREMHEKPDVPNFGPKGSGPLLTPGDTIAIEPLASLGNGRIRQLDDGWTLATYDGSIAAQFEHTVLITETGAEILTQL